MRTHWGRCLHQLPSSICTWALAACRLPPRPMPPLPPPLPPAVGFPPGKSFVLYGPENDRSMGLRNRLAMWAAESMGRYASRTQFCEVGAEEGGGGTMGLRKRLAYICRTWHCVTSGGQLNNEPPPLPSPLHRLSWYRMVGRLHSATTGGFTLPWRR